MSTTPPDATTGLDLRPPSDRRGLVYVAGYGRSGSTVLDVALSAHPEIVGLGELRALFAVLADPPDDLDPFWAELGATTRSVERSRGTVGFVAAARLATRAERLPSLTGLRPRSGLRRRYLTFQAPLFDELFTATGASVLVDSSKTSWLNMWRLPLLRSILPDSRCLILVRAPGSVVASVRAGRGDTLEPQRLPTARSIVGWSVANVAAVLVGLRWCGQDRTRVVRYEDLVGRPAETLAAIVAWVGLDQAEAHRPEAVSDGFTPGLQIGGNRVRHQARIRIGPGAGSAPAHPRGWSSVAVRLVSWLVERLALARVEAIEPAGADHHRPAR